MRVQPIGKHVIQCESNTGNLVDIHLIDWAAKIRRAYDDWGNAERVAKLVADDLGLSRAGARKLTQVAIERFNV